MNRKLKTVAWAIALLAGTSGAANTAFAQVSDDVVKIGIITDMSGMYSDLSGPGSVIAAKMAIEDFGKTVLGKPIELLVTDSLNKADVAASKAREWIDRDKVDALMDLVPTSVALSVIDVAKQKNKLAIVVGSGSGSITNEKCTDISAHWMYDTYSVSVGTGKAMMQRGNNSWYFLTADYAFGKALEKDVTDVVNANGGKVLGTARHPINSSDFSSFLLQAQASKAKVIALANAGGDSVNAAKQAGEFGLSTQGQIVVPLMLMISEVHSIGLKLAQGMYLTEAFYWDYNDQTRAWSKRFFEQHKKMPTSGHAGMYSAVTHYLKAIKAAGTDDTTAVMKTMREMPISDPLMPKGTLRKDGRVVHDMLLVQIKKPEESKGAWDYYKVLNTIPGEAAFRPLENSDCSLVKK